MQVYKLGRYREILRSMIVRFSLKFLNISAFSGVKLNKLRQGKNFNLPKRKLAGLIINENRCEKRGIRVLALLLNITGMYVR